jgi:hypothetical protein
MPCGTSVPRANVTTARLALLVVAMLTLPFFLEELSFSAGDVITLIDCPPAEEWWRGECGGKVGYFPAKYCKKWESAPSTS